MRHLSLIIIILSTISCIKSNELDTDKYNDLTIQPDILLPFFEVKHGYEYYDSIVSISNITREITSEIPIDLFRNDSFDKVVQMEFFFTVENGLPTNFDCLKLILLNENKEKIDSINLDHIPRGELDNECKLISPSIKKYDAFIFNNIELLTQCRYIKTVLSWSDNMIASSSDSYYIKTYSFVIFRTHIDTG